MGGRRPMITLQEAAERLGVHYMTAYKYVRTGRLRAVKEGAEWRLDPADVEALRNGTAPGRRRTPRSDVWRRLQDRLVAGDEPGAWALVEGVLASGAGPDEIYLDLLAPAMRGVGDAWQKGRLGVAAEHRAAAVAQRLVGRLGPHFTRPGRRRGTVVVGAPSGELHGLPVSMLADLLRFAGFQAVDVGPNTPAESFVDAARAADRLVAVALCITTAESEPALAEAVRALRKAEVGVPILVGGAGVDDDAHADRLGADGYTGADARAAVAAVEAVA